MSFSEKTNSFLRNSKEIVGNLFWATNARAKLIKIYGHPRNWITVGMDKSQREKLLKAMEADLTDGIKKHNLALESQKTNENEIEKIHVYNSELKKFIGELKKYITDFD
jgi:hypothetical protein